MLKLHHSVADGASAVAIMGSLFDFEPDVADPPPVPSMRQPIPNGMSLLADNVSSKVRALGHTMAGLAHPERALDAIRVFSQVLMKSVGVMGAPRSSLNQPVREGRRVRFLRMDLASMKDAAHAHGGKVNDVVLTLWSGGLRELLDARGELLTGDLTTGMAVSTRVGSDATIDNQAGTVVLPLPTSEAAVERRLGLIIGTTRRVKDRQRPAAIMGAVVGLTATPLGRYFLLHQRATNVFSTNVVGPSAPAYVLGARVMDILPMVDLGGNVGLSLCAFSYAGTVSLVVTADAEAFPDLDVLMAGMERDWHALSTTSSPLRVVDPAGRSSKPATPSS
jgi:WS/DGAT/MGAT family acyltransferase